MIEARFKCSDGERKYEINTIRSTGLIERRKFNQDKLVKVKLFGEIAKTAGRDVFELAVTSVREAISAIDHLTKHRTTKLFVKLHDKVRWKVIVNGVSMRGTDPHVCDELTLERDLETIEIYPVAQGAGFNFIEAILGALLVIVGIVLAFVPGLNILGISGAIIGIDLALGGVALLLGGLAQLFISPNQSQKQKSANNQPSYLFSGTVNTVDQGGPVPVAYGQLICGSQLIAATVTSSAVTYIGAAVPAPVAPTAPTVTGPPPVAPGALGWTTPLPPSNATQLIINTWWNLNLGYQVQQTLFGKTSIVILKGSPPTQSAWVVDVTTAGWKSFGTSALTPVRTLPWASSPLPAAGASVLQIQIWWNGNLNKQVEAIYKGAISYPVISGPIPNQATWNSYITTYGWTSQGAAVIPPVLPGQPPPSNVKTPTAKGPIPPINATPAAIATWWNANLGLTVNSKFGLIQISGSPPSTTAFWADLITNAQYTLAPSGSFNSSLVPPTSDITPVTITPMIQEYMDLAQLSEWPNGPEVLTAQPGAVQGQPFWAIKHWDGSLGLIYTLESDGPEQNFAFPQMIDESIVVTNAPSLDLTGYVNPNPIPPPIVPPSPVLEATCTVSANFTATLH